MHKLVHGTGSIETKSFFLRILIALNSFFPTIDTGLSQGFGLMIAQDIGMIKDRGDVKAGQTLLLCAFGGGVTWGSAILRW